MGGDSFGHDVLIFVSDDMMNLFDLDEQERFSQLLRDDLNRATREIEDERVRMVAIRSADDSDIQSQMAISVPREPRPDPETAGIWKGNHLRLFLSHRDEYKKFAHAFAKVIEPYGVSVFVAHDAILPMKEWQKEIRIGLSTMEAMLVLLTDDFHDSSWTDQEIGFALGRDIPVICLKVGHIDPKGFVGFAQAVRSSLENIGDAVPLVIRTLFKETGQADRIKDVLIEALVSSTCYIDAMENLERLKCAVENLSDADLDRIIEGYM